MATPKRKRTTTRSIPTKRPKHVDSEDEGSPTEAFWDAERILKERRVRGKLQYLIEWKGIDATTGEPYSPTWEPKDNPTPDLVAAWEEKKRAATSSSIAASLGEPKGRPRKSSLSRPARKARLVESSPELSPTHTTSAFSHPTIPNDEGNVPPLSADTTTPIDAISAKRSKRPSPKIQVGHRGDSFDPNEFEPFSQLAASQPPSSTPTNTQETVLVSSQLFVARPEHHSSGVVPDSQSSVGESSFVPATQQTTGTTQQSSTGNESQEDVTEDSGLLEIVGEAAASKGPSPARSIPETVYDTTSDSQSQRRRLASQERVVEISSVSGAPEHTSQANNETEFQTESQVGTPTEGQSQVDDHSSLEHPSPPSPCQASPQAAPQDSEKVPFGDRLLEDQNQSVGNHDDTTALTSLPRGASEFNLDTVVKEHSRRNQVLSIEEQTVSVAQESQSGEPQREQSSSQDTAEASPAEHSVLDGAGPAPNRSHYPQLDPADIAQVSASQIIPGVLEEPSIADASLANGPAYAQTESAGALPIETSAASLTQLQVSPNNTQASGPTHAEPSLPSLVPSTQTEDEVPPSQFIEPECPRSRASTVAQQTVVELETVVQSTYGTAEDEAVLRRDFALDSQTSRSTVSREQNAQVVPLQQDLSTQEDTAASIRPSVEIEYQTDRSTPDSRHDSSQDTPERSKSLVATSCSPIAQPPSYSLPALDSNIPLRPPTPILTSSISVMTTPGSAANVRRQVQDALAKASEEAGPFTPTRRPRRSNVNATSSVTTSTPGETSHAVASNSNRQLLGAGASPSLVATDGTRSPSTVPDRSPAPSVPTSLRTIALTRATQVPAERIREAETANPQENVIGKVTTVMPAIVTTEPTVPEEPSSDNDIMSDASDNDTESLLNDDLQLDTEEYIVPLFIDGRQGDEYTRRVKNEKDLLEAFARDRDGFEPFAKIEKLLTGLRNLETHFDLVFEEAGPSSSGLDGASQMQWLRQFGADNSAKFKFLHALFYEARKRNEEKHIVIVIENENELLLHIIETFCKACFVQYSMPTKDCQPDYDWVGGDLLVTIFPSTMSPIIRPPDIIICLDGVQEAQIIRQKNWARHPEMAVVPVLHLIISRTVGHIERYLSSSLSERERAHTIVATLAYMHSQLGEPIDEDMPRAPATAEKVAEWLRADNYPRDWPLGSIGSVKDVIEFQTQAPESSPVVERAKRPHEDETFDPAKRMRLTPQPQAGPSSSIDNNDVTRISDSMPGTITEMSSLRARINHLEEALRKEKAARRAEQAHYHEQELAWDKQQTTHEDLRREYRILLGKHQSSEEQVRSLTKTAETLRERLETRTMELRNRDEQLKDQRDTHSLSEDAKIAEITKLRGDVARAIADRERAMKSATSADGTLEYTKEQYRLAQEAATTSAARVTELEAEVAKLSHIASGQPAALKKLFLNHQYTNQATQIKSLKAENSILRKSMQQKDEELQRAKMSVGRPGVGTRATSATPQPNKVRSRAASPANRLSNLRNG